MLNLTKLFYASYADTEHLHGALMPEEEQKAFLRSCRTKIKDYLKPAIAEATVSVLGMRKQVQPRFRTQGSWAYNTCIQPAHKFDQEMDLDYGVYLPVDVWQENGPPAEMAKAYFDLVESLLQILCVQENGRWSRVMTRKTPASASMSQAGHTSIFLCMQLRPTILRRWWKRPPCSKRKLAL